MIITESKPVEEVMEMVETFDKIFIIGCGNCATSCQTGGEDQVHEMLSKLSNKVIGSAVPEEPCDLRLVRRDLKPHRETIKSADALLVMSCGAGVGTVEKHTGKPVLPALETVFIGSTERLGKFYRMCNACGECVLDETGGICPISRCAKSLLNGPCGGQVEGKCEVGDYENDCAWVLIYESLKDKNMLDLYTTFRPPRDHSRKVLKNEVIF